MQNHLALSRGTPTELGNTKKEQVLKSKLESRRKHLKKANSSGTEKEAEIIST